MTTHTIQYGETLSKIAREYNTTVDELAKKNNITNPNSIMAGTTIDVGENFSNYDDYTSESKTDNSTKYLALAAAGAWTPAVKTGYDYMKTKKEEASRKLQNMEPEEKNRRKNSAIKGAILGSALPGIGNVIGAFIGWLKG